MPVPLWAPLSPAPAPGSCALASALAEGLQTGEPSALPLSQASWAPATKQASQPPPPPQAERQPGAWEAWASPHPVL